MQADQLALRERAAAHQQGRIECLQRDLADARHAAEQANERLERSEKALLGQCTQRFPGMTRGDVA